MEGGRRRRRRHPPNAAGSRRRRQRRPEPWLLPFTPSTRQDYHRRGGALRARSLARSRLFPPRPPPLAKPSPPCPATDFSLAPSLAGSASSHRPIGKQPGAQKGGACRGQLSNGILSRFVSLRRRRPPPALHASKELLSGAVTAQNGSLGPPAKVGAFRCCRVVHFASKYA